MIPVVNMIIFNTDAVLISVASKRTNFLSHGSKEDSRGARTRAGANSRGPIKTFKSDIYSESILNQS